MSLPSRLHVQGCVYGIALVQLAMRERRGVQVDDSSVKGGRRK